MAKTPLEKKLEDLFTPVIDDLGYALVQVKIMGAGKNSQIVQVMAENPETKRLGVDECAVISRELSAVMDVEDPIKGKYRLELSSPGIDRPLKTLEEFKTYKEFEVKIQINPPLDTGQKRFRGFITEVENETIFIKTDNGDFELPFSNIESARLVLTDELIKATKPDKTTSEAVVDK